MLPKKIYGVSPDDTRDHSIASYKPQDKNVDHKDHDKQQKQRSRGVPGHYI
jgi:hypothetical protein